jgi:hypothetical protein
MVTIEEKYKMIHEFMGITPDYKSSKYHTSWEWLMPVVKQCKNILSAPRNGDDVYVLLDLESAILSCDKTIVFNGVVGFINWYNKQK